MTSDAIISLLQGKRRAWSAQGVAFTLRQAILRGRIKPDDTLPTIRDLASALRIAPGTVSRAYQILRDDGFVRTPEYTRDRYTVIFDPQSEKRKAQVRILVRGALGRILRSGYSREDLREACTDFFAT
jgi:GntR family transcriptional regulator